MLMIEAFVFCNCLVTFEMDKNIGENHDKYTLFEGFVKQNW